MMYPSEENFNLAQLFLSRVMKYQNRKALIYKSHLGGFAHSTWNEWKDDVEKCALGLYALGVRKGDRIGILSENRPEWTFADLGILSLGAVAVPIYPTSQAQDVIRLIEDAGIEVLFVSSVTQFDKVRVILNQAQLLRQIIIFDATAESLRNVLQLEDFFKKGERELLNNPNLYREMVHAVRPDDLATIIYTSGTTGIPKGVMLTHRNLVANWWGAKEYIPVSDHDVTLSFLPLSHIFERLAGYYFMLAQGATIAYAENMQTVGEDMLRIHPTVTTAVPRFFEKIYTRIQEAIENAPPFRRNLLSWAAHIGRSYARKQLKKESISINMRVGYLIASLLVFRKLRKSLGGKIRFFISGGAPLSKELAEFFYSVGVLILEGYGLTETSPVVAVNSYHDFKFGTVGKALANIEIKIDADCEILTRGPCVMRGYYRNEQATQEVIRNGWFYTGDIGFIDECGFLKITDRKKDIIITSAGKNIAPQKIENLIRGDPVISQVVVIGDKKNYLVALVFPKRDEVERYAHDKGFTENSYSQILKSDLVYRWIEDRIRDRIKDLSTYEQIKYFALLDHDLTLERGEMTPTMKIKRKIIQDKYAKVIDDLYRVGNRYAFATA